MSKWILGYAMIFVILAVVIFFDIKNNHKSQRKAIILAIFSFAAGLVLYTIGYFQSGYSFILSFIRGFYSAIRMFFINDDFSQIQEAFNNNGLISIEWVQIIFSTLHVIAAYVTAYSIYRLILTVSHKFLNTLKLSMSYRKKLYIIIGDDIKSEYLANHIPNKGAHVVFFTHDTYDRYSNNIDSSIITYKISDLFKNGQLDDALLRIMGIKRKRLKSMFCEISNKLNIKCKSVYPQIEVVALTGNQYFNISFGLEFIKHIYEIKKYKIQIKLHLLLNHELISDYTFTHLNDYSKNNEYAKHLEINLIDEYSLAVTHLLKDYPLYNNLSIDESKASIDQQEINILIVGFDTIGEILLYRLLETENYVDAYGNLVPIRVFVFDERWDSISNLFNDAHPTFKIHFPNVEFHSSDINSNVFHDFINNKNVEWQYIAIGYVREETNLQTALQLHRILSNKSQERPICIATYVKKLNRTYKSFETIIMKNQIKMFGNIESIFTPDNIFNQVTDKLAKMINFDYEIRQNNNPMDINELWLKLDLNDRDSNRSAANHLFNKLRLLGYKNLDELPSSPLIIDNIQAKTNLAIIEHARWNAFHKLRDWTACSYEELQDLISNNLIEIGKHKSKLLRKHYTLVEWDKLDDISKKLEKEAKTMTGYTEPISYFKSLDIDQIDTLINFVNQVRKDLVPESAHQTTEEIKTKQTYTPVVIDTSKVTLNASILELSEQLAKNTHENWSLNRIKDGWKYGPKHDDLKKEHPSLIPYEELSESEKQYDRTTSMETIKLLISLGYKITKE